MGKFYGAVGFAEVSETAPSVYEETIVEKYYYGDVTKRYIRYDESGQVNPNLQIVNSITIKADPYSAENAGSIRYVKYLGSKWRVSSFDYNPPNLNLELGGLYNENTT